MFLGGVVLADENGQPYAAGTPIQDSVVKPWAILGSVVLIDPANGEPYVIGDGEVNG